jgi:hypothetical protein
MNRILGRFVLSSQCPGHLPQLDVARIEGELAPSGLDRIRAATAPTVAGATAFLFLTQRDTNNATVGAVVVLTTQLPSILKVVTKLVQKDTAGASGQRNA